MAKFDDLISTVGKFVDVQKGAWDHLEWERLVSKVQRMGYEMSGDIIHNLGTTVESLKKLYITKTNKDDMLRVVTDIPKAIARFIDETRGMWEHADWLRLLKEVEKVGIAISEETQKHIGDMLEASKRLYSAPYKEPVVEVKPTTVDPIVEIASPAASAAEAEKPTEPIDAEKPEVVKPYETEMKKYIATEAKKHVASAAKKTTGEKAEKKIKASGDSDDEPKVKRPYKKKAT
ncbi:hypothetical protein [Candidatus Magnetominusculus xianensis]|uniref:Uncharacterized protein n=1 Tax=Candidatus Magnetominusculus xianensis TaxID=1748249 RepID=A0ABR5SD23_9BACT|nr:hypothetical protein [Candidatus Magnetominusculus xianensis]KWT75938.1 hypothetical protein ASN18_3178 [Candidatus Magnetominusculus xianensis]MBF0405032.1 hypothetical protein [Nitrospirota bacterium]